MKSIKVPALGVVLKVLAAFPPSIAKLINLVCYITK